MSDVTTVAAALAATCAMASWAAQGTGGSQGQPAPTAPPGVVATVNEQPITEAQWVARTRRVRPVDFAIPGRPGQLRDVPAGQVALERIIFERLLLQYAARTNLLPNDTALDAALEAAKKDPQVARALTDGLMDESTLREDLLGQISLVNVATINERVTPEEVQAQYKRIYLDPKRWSVAAIRVSSRAKADQVLAELKKGTAFADVAARLSEDAATRNKGGEVGVVLSGDPNLSPALRQALAALKPGETSDAIALTMAGAAQPVFTIIKLLADVTPVPPRFEQVQASVERMAVLAKAGAQATVQRKIDEFRKQSKIVVYVKGYEGLSTK